MIVAITGNIGSGKSVVAHHLTELLGAMHCDTDRVCRALLEKGQPGWVEVERQWGARFLDQVGNIDRKSLRATVFESEEIRLQLENILHPFVHAHVTNLMKRCRSEKRLLIVEVPLLFEVGWQNDFDYIVTVSAGKHDTLNRVVTRDTVSAEHVEKILNTQLDITDKVQRSDFVIDNSGTLENTYVQIDLLKASILAKQSEA